MPPDDGRRISPPAEILAGPTGGEWQTDAALRKRLEAYAQHRVRADAMAEYIRPMVWEKSPEMSAFAAMRECGRSLEWRHYYAAGRSSLLKARTCKKHHLCPMCASLRGLRLAAAYRDRVELVMRGHSTLELQLVTLTVKDGADLVERFSHLHESLRILRKRSGRGNAPTEWDKIVGAVWSFEVKRGLNSGLWHPHVHALAVVKSPIEQAMLSDQWHSITGDSMIVDVRPVNPDQHGAFVECFKYALKFSEMTIPDNFDAWVALRGRRLIASSGVLRGIDHNLDLMDPVEDDPRYYDILFHFMPSGIDTATGEIRSGARYQFVGRNPRPLTHE
jgi:hypothetical protein